MGTGSAGKRLDMNIKQAKTEIASTIRAYRLRDAQGNLKIPRVRQRPILLMGPPGIGKTAVLKQVAEAPSAEWVAAAPVGFSDFPVHPADGKPEWCWQSLFLPV